MARIIEEIAVLIGADTRGLDKGMKKTQKRVNVLTRSFKRMGATLIAAFGARALFRGFQRTLSNTNALIKTAKGVGFLATEYQALIFSLDQVGVKASSARIALGDFQKRLGKAIAGTSPQFAKAFRDAGLDPFALSSLDPAEAFDVALKRLAELKNDPRLAGLTGAVFEEQSGKDVLQVIRQWEKYLAAREKFAKRVGSITKGQQDNIEELSEELRVYRAQWENLKATIVADAAPAILSALSGMEEAGVFKKMGEQISALVDSLEYLQILLRDTFGTPKRSRFDTLKDEFEREVQGQGLLTGEAQAKHRRRLKAMSKLSPGFDTPTEMKTKRGIRLHLESLPPIKYEVIVRGDTSGARRLGEDIVAAGKRERDRQQRAGAQ
jgi:hypothetical protein